MDGTLLKAPSVVPVLGFKSTTFLSLTTRTPDAPKTLKLVTFLISTHLNYYKDLRESLNVNPYFFFPPGVTKSNL